MTYKLRIKNSGKTRYAGHNMPTSHILPGAMELARIPTLSTEAKKRLDWFDFYRANKENAALIENLQTDNGSEFAKYFREAAAELSLPHYHSRPRTPKDNPVDERFNGTIEREFLQLGNMSTDCDAFNRKMTEWLIEYNFKRPHQTLGYEVPVEYHYKNQKVSPMYPSSTAA